MPRPPDGERANPLVAVTAAAIMSVLCYLGGFFVLLMDRPVFNNWIFQHTPPSFHQFARTIYWPVIELLERLSV